jgi:adenosylcobinamide-phosphate synthase
VEGQLITLWIAIAADLAIGDPVYPLHPVRLMGAMLSRVENALRSGGADGYGGGIALFLILGVTWTAAIAGMVRGAAMISGAFAFVIQIFFVYSFLAMGDLVRHVWRVERALAGDNLAAGRNAIAALVGRDTDRMDAGACRRAAIESLSENLTDGFTSPLFWYVLAGLPGLVVFKVVSTMDSMVGYKTPRYLRFGWCGARLDDAMNYIPARLTWLLIAGVAALVPACSGGKALRIGAEQHRVLLGPNAGWSEAATAGGIRRRLVGPIFLHGQLVTDAWIGDPADPPAESHADVLRALVLVVATGIAAALACGLVMSGRP